MVKLMKLDARGLAAAALGVLLLAGAGPVQAQGKLSDAEVRRRIIQQSIDGYSGRCACPYSTMSNGRSCGGRSAYSKPGGEAPLCYPEDVSASMVKAYRQHSGR